jgi:hypothetical protein
MQIISELRNYVSMIVQYTQDRFVESFLHFIWNGDLHFIKRKLNLVNNLKQKAYKKLATGDKITINLDYLIEIYI